MDGLILGIFNEYFWTDYHIKLGSFADLMDEMSRYKNICIVHMHNIFLLF